jgi:regulator of protease activity HflC (stomatin/prohibitin superfamily)
VIIVPTSLKQLIFGASQLTLDNILIRLRGFAIYRISSPEKIYERISFWERQSGEKKLALMIGEQSRSHSKWLVANMTLEDCLRKRKQAIADVLLNELRLVITEENFGVSIETIDIQDIKIIQEDLFRAYQSPASETLFKNQQLSELEREREVQTLKLRQQQEISERTKETRLKVLANEAQIQQAERENKEKELQAQRQVERDQAEHKRMLAELEEEQIRTRRQKDTAVEREIALAQQELEKQKADLELEVLRERYNIDNILSPIAMEKLFLEKSLPEIAQALTAALGEARVTIYQGPDGGSGLPFSMVVNEILGLLQRRLDRLKEANGEDGNPP